MVEVINNLTEWVQAKVCTGLEFKKPKLIADNEYEYELVTPIAYSCFCPPQIDNDSQPSAPSVTVQVDEFSEQTTAEKDIKVALIFIVWNPGLHDSSSGTMAFTPDYEGWHDLWHFIDKTTQAIRNDFSVGGYEVKSEIKGRPLLGDHAIMGTYPFYMGEVTFSIGTISSPIRNKAIRDML